MSRQGELIDYVFEGRGEPLSGEVLCWMDASARFTVFVEAYRDKIRKKIRVTPDAESLLDVRSELEVAYRLLKDRRLSVAYEPYASARRRGPDFAVTYRVNLIFNVEVARVRVAETGLEGLDLPRREERLMRLFLYKLGQMQPGMANLLVIHTREELARSIDLGRLMQEVKMRTDRKDPSFYAATHYSNPAAFYKDFLRLTGILVWAPGGPLWVNKQARPALSDDVLRLVFLLASGDMPASST